MKGAVRVLLRTYRNKLNQKARKGDGVQNAIAEDEKSVTPASNKTKKARKKALKSLNKKADAKRKHRKLSPQERRLQKDFHDDIDKIAAELKRRRSEHHETIPADILENLSRRIGDPSTQSALHVNGTYFASGLYWLDREKMDIQDIRRYLRLSLTPKGPMYFDNGDHYGLIHPFNESLAKMVKHSLALSVLKLRASGEIPSNPDLFNDETDLFEAYFIRNEGAVYFVGIYNGSQLDQSFDFHFDEDERSIDEVLEAVTEPLSEEAIDSGKELKVQKHLVDVELLNSNTITGSRSEYSFDKRKRNILLGFAAAIVAAALAVTMGIYGYLAYQHAEQEKVRKAEQKRQAALIRQKQAAEKLRLDSIAALRFERTQLSNKDVYTPILSKSLQLAKSISFNKGLDKWILDEWNCEVERTKGTANVYAVFNAKCFVTYKGEALSEPASFNQYEALAKKTISNDAQASFEASKNYAVLSYTIPLGHVSEDYAVNLSDRFDAIRTLRELQSSLELKNIPLNYFDRGELELEKRLKNQLLVESTSGGKTFPYGYVAWELKAKINDLAAEDMNVMFPPELYITHMTGNYRNISINGVYHYE